MPQKAKGKWKAKIQHGGRRRYLGYFDDEDAAAVAYSTAAQAVQATGALPQKEGGRRTSSMHRGVSWSKANCKWKAQIEHHGRKRHLGYFSDEGAAAGAYNRAAKAVQTTGTLPRR